MKKYLSYNYILTKDSNQYVQPMVILLLGRSNPSYGEVRRFSDLLKIREIISKSVDKCRFTDYTYHMI